jgi:hypothetical protein
MAVRKIAWKRLKAHYSDRNKKKMYPHMSSSDLGEMDAGSRSSYSLNKKHATRPEDNHNVFKTDHK